MTTLYLLDTSVVSSVGPGRTGIGDELATWIIINWPRLHLSAVSVYEIEQGARKLLRNGATRRAEMTSTWLDGLIEQFGERLLAVDTEVAREAGRLSDWALEYGIHPGMADITIAATATHHDLRLLTYNMKHFGPLEIGAIDPSEQLPR